MIAPSRKVASPWVVNINDLRGLAKRRLPKAVFDYLDGGAEGEITLGENRRAFEAITFRPRQAVAVGACDLRTRVLGTEISFPAILAPPCESFGSESPAQEVVERVRESK